MPREVIRYVIRYPTLTTESLDQEHYHLVVKGDSKYKFINIDDLPDDNSRLGNESIAHMFNYTNFETSTVNDTKMTLNSER